MLAGEHSWTVFPKEFPIHAVGGNKHVLPIQETEVDTFSIGCGSAGCAAVEAMDSFVLGGQDYPAPFFATGPAV